MGTDAKTLLEQVKAAFAERHQWMLDIHNATQAGMADSMTRSMGEDGVSQKTLSNIKNLVGDPRISTYARRRQPNGGFPVWAMMIPETTKDMFEDRTRMNRLVKAMQDYLACSDGDRRSIEGMAAGLAKLGG